MLLEPRIASRLTGYTGGTLAYPLRAFKPKTIIPVKMQLSCGGGPVTACTHTIQLVKASSATAADTAIDATPTDPDTTGNAFRLTDASTGECHFNVATKSLSKGVWQVKVTLSDRIVHGELPCWQTEVGPPPPERWGRRPGLWRAAIVGIAGGPPRPC